MAPVQTFPTADGWIFVMCMTDKFFVALTKALERSELVGDARFATPAARQDNRDALTAEIDREFRKQPNSHWLARLNGVLPIAPVLDLARALDNPFLRTTGMVADVPHPTRPDLRALANPIKIDGQRLTQQVCHPLGADNAELLAGMAPPPAVHPA